MLTKQQLQERKHYIGGSDAGAVAGFSKYRSPLDVYRDKTEDPIEIDKPIHMHWGTMLEPFVREEFERIKETKVEIVKDTKLHPKYTFLAANIDGRLDNGELLEIKCTTFWGRKRFENNNFPLEYICQCAHYASIYNAPVVHLAVFVGIDQPLQLYKYERDKDFEDKLINKEIDFWRQHVLQRRAPEPRTYSEIVKEFNTMPEYSDELNTTLVATPNIEDEYFKLINLSEKQKELENKIKDHKAIIMKFLKTNERLIDKAGDALCTWKFRKNNRFDTTKFKKEQPDLYEKYLNHNHSRTFLIK
ncbi:MAG: YqaJ viral recombinase family protein [Candidatus Bathyarchaeia archaeon]